MPGEEKRRNPGGHALPAESLNLLDQGAHPIGQPTQQDEGESRIGRDGDPQRLEADLDAPSGLAGDRGRRVSPSHKQGNHTQGAPHSFIVG